MDYLTVKDVAELVRRNEETIRRMIRARKLDVTLDNNNRHQGYQIPVDELTRTWAITREEVERYIDQRRAQERTGETRLPLGPERERAAGARRPAPAGDAAGDAAAGGAKPAEHAEHGQRRTAAAALHAQEARTDADRIGTAAGDGPDAAETAADGAAGPAPEAATPQGADAPGCDGRSDAAGTAADGAAGPAPEADAPQGAYASGCDGRPDAADGRPRPDELEDWCLELGEAVARALTLGAERVAGEIELVATSARRAWDAARADAQHAGGGSDMDGDWNGWHDARTGQPSASRPGDTANDRPARDEASPDWELDLSAASERVSEIFGDAYRQIRSAVERATASVPGRERTAARHTGRAEDAAAQARRTLARRHSNIRDTIARAMQADASKPPANGAPADAQLQEHAGNAPTAEPAQAHPGGTQTDGSAWEHAGGAQTDGPAWEHAGGAQTDGPAWEHAGGAQANRHAQGTPWCDARPTDAPELDEFRGRRPEFEPEHESDLGARGFMDAEDNASYQLLQAARRAVRQRMESSGRRDDTAPAAHGCAGSHDGEGAASAAVKWGFSPTGDARRVTPSDGAATGCATDSGANHRAGAEPAVDDVVDAGANDRASVNAVDAMGDVSTNDHTGVNAADGMADVSANDHAGVNAADGMVDVNANDHAGINAADGMVDVSTNDHAGVNAAADGTNEAHTALRHSLGMARTPGADSVGGAGNSARLASWPRTGEAAYGRGVDSEAEATSDQRAHPAHTAATAACAGRALASAAEAWGAAAVESAGQPAQTEAAAGRREAGRAECAGAVQPGAAQAPTRDAPLCQAREHEAVNAWGFAPQRPRREHAQWGFTLEAEGTAAAQPSAPEHAATHWGIDLAEPQYAPADSGATPGTATEPAAPERAAGPAMPTAADADGADVDAMRRRIAELESQLSQLTEQLDNMNRRLADRD